jgi:hypothetical protein
LPALEQSTQLQHPRATKIVADVIDEATRTLEMIARTLELAELNGHQGQLQVRVEDVRALFLPLDANRQRTFVFSLRRVKFALSKVGGRQRLVRDRLVTASARGIGCLPRCRARRDGVLADQEK